MSRTDNMPAPQVSILVPVYNAEKYLALTLESVQAQTCQSWELIAVDDGSKDGSAKIVRHHAGPRRAYPPGAAEKQRRGGGA